MPCDCSGIRLTPYMSFIGSVLTRPGSSVVAPP